MALLYRDYPGSNVLQASQAPDGFCQGVQMRPRFRDPGFLSRCYFVPVAWNEAGKICFGIHGTVSHFTSAELPTIVPGPCGTLDARGKDGQLRGTASDAVECYALARIFILLSENVYHKSGIDGCSERLDRHL
jgi:hypothetical protein